MTSSTSPETHVCINHPSLRARNRCRKCGMSLCDDCVRMDYGTTFCEQCYAGVVRDRQERAEHRAATAVSARAVAEAARAGKRQSLLNLCIGLVTNPRDTLENRLVDYVDTPSAFVRILLFYLISVGALLTLELMVQRRTAPDGAGLLPLMHYVPGPPLGAGASIVCIFSLVELLLTAFLFAFVNSCFKNDDLLGGFLSLLTRLAFVWGMTQVALLLLLLIADSLGVSDLSLLLLMATAVSLWRLGLNVLVLCASYDYNAYAAFLGLWAAHFVTKMAATVLSAFV